MGELRTMEALMQRDDVQTWEDRGAAALQQGRYHDAARAYRRAVSLDTERATSWDGLGRAELYLKHDAQALQAFDRALALDPSRVTDARFCTFRGLALLAARRWEDALTSFDDALRLDMHQYSAWQGKMNALIHLRRLWETWSVFKHVVRLYAGTPVKERWDR